MDNSSIVLDPIMSTFIFFLIYLPFIISMDKLIKAVRAENDELTYISRAWVWTQWIPIWNTVAIVVYHVKILGIIRYLEINYKLERNELKYPFKTSWFFIIIFGSNSMICLLGKSFFEDYFKIFTENIELSYLHYFVIIFAIIGIIVIIILPFLFIFYWIKIVKTRKIILSINPKNL